MVRLFLWHEDGFYVLTQWEKGCLHFCPRNSSASSLLFLFVLLSIFQNVQFRFSLRSTEWSGRVRNGWRHVVIRLSSDIGLLQIGSDPLPCRGIAVWAAQGLWLSAHSVRLQYYQVPKSTWVLSSAIPQKCVECIYRTTVLSAPLELAFH